MASGSKKGKRTVTQGGKKNAAPLVVTQLDPVAHERNTRANGAELKVSAILSCFEI